MKFPVIKTNCYSTNLKVRIIYSNSGRGLKIDADLLKKILQEYACDVQLQVTDAWSLNQTINSHRFAKFKSFLPDTLANLVNQTQVRLQSVCRESVDLQIHLESLAVEFIGAARINWLIPNQEWVRTQHLCFFKYLDKVLCKTEEAYQSLHTHHHAVELIGFSNPLMQQLPLIDGPVSRMRRFLHVAGANRKKGTLPIIAAWSEHPEWPDLNLVIDDDSALSPLPKNIIVWKRPDDETIARLRQQCGIVIAPSEVEGFGHILVEAMAYQQVVVTTDAAPMNEIIQTDRGFLLPWSTSQACHLGRRYFVDAKAIEAKVTEILETSITTLQNKSYKARRWCINNHQRFISSLTAKVDEARGFELFSIELDKPAFVEQKGE